ncbi:hypothetical protein ACFFQW_02140 [Umezawaea endophytica]|uniref:Uncharacterized protein n=1 Tax=Umezawaea endophytica TaxID=1654476 RepID=A0A9X2VHW5_9PSEU|nr:hypothetical protein [Umezawaea endophytica]MCS7477050.1 hypothetical protein [Umezawaea endophytica]
MPDDAGQARDSVTGLALGHPRDGDVVEPGVVRLGARRIGRA